MPRSIQCRPPEDEDGRNRVSADALHRPNMGRTWGVHPRNSQAWVGSISPSRPRGTLEWPALLSSTPGAGGWGGGGPSDVAAHLTVHFFRCICPVLVASASLEPECPYWIRCSAQLNLGLMRPHFGGEMQTFVME